MDSQDQELDQELDQQLGPNELQSERSLLGKAFAERIETLGLSRRALTERSGLSRQTLHNIEHGGQTKFQPQTLRMLEEALLWKPGTCLELINGIDNTKVDETDAIQIIERLSTLKWWIVERIKDLSIDDLERIISFLEHFALGERNEGPLDTVEMVTRRVDERQRLLAEMKYLPPPLGEVDSDDDEGSS